MRTDRVNIPSHRLRGSATATLLKRTISPREYVREGVYVGFVSRGAWLLGVMSRRLGGDLDAWAREAHANDGKQALPETDDEVKAAIKKQASASAGRTADPPQLHLSCESLSQREHVDEARTYIARVPRHAGLHARLRRMHMCVRASVKVEYYFSDANFRKDKFLLVRLAQPLCVAARL